MSRKRKRLPSRRKLNSSYGLNFESLEPRQMLAVTLGSSWPNIDSSNVFTPDEVTQENVVRDYLSANEATAYLQDGDSNLRLVEVKSGLASTTTRFQQTIDGIPVYGGFVTVNQGPNGEFQQIFDQGFEDLQTENAMGPVISMEMAEGLALNNIGATRTFADSKGEMVWYPGEDGSTAEQSYQMTVYASDPSGDYLTVINPETGEVDFQENRASFATGYVYIPNPIQRVGFGLGGFDDNNDADSFELTTVRSNVTLLGLTPAQDFLVGEYADLATLDSVTAPFDSIPDAEEPTGVFEYTRSDDRFEQVNTYFSIDGQQRYIQLMGFSDSNGTPNGIRDFPTLANAHWNADDNSFYSTGDDALHFGDGGVDDAEDADIIAHEYGHAMQFNQNAAWGGGEMAAMGEGFGDYWAATFYFKDGSATHQADHAAAIGEWDATPTGAQWIRRVDGTKMYPDALTGEPHEDGEIWSAALWDLRNDLGEIIVDPLILESHFGLAAASTMQDGAVQILLADVNMNGGANGAAIRAVFEARGILEPLPFAGQVTFDSPYYKEIDTIVVTLVDANPAEPITVTIDSSGGDSETFTLPNIAFGTFEGTILTTGDPAVGGDGTLQVSLGDTITVTYNDPDNDGAGTPGTNTDTAIIANITVYPSTDTPLAITDNNTTTSIINVPDVGVVNDLNVTIDITHTWDSDLDVFLESPSGTVVELFTAVGGSGDNFIGTELDDEAALSISSASAPFTGIFSPEGNLSDVDFMTMTGDWTLTVTDNFNGDQGSLDAWALVIDVVQPGLGEVSFDAKHYDYTDLIEVNLFDLNAVGDQTAIIESTGGDIETVTLVDNLDGTFTGSLLMDAGPNSIVTEDALLQGNPADIFTVTYFDVDDGNGSFGDRTDIANIKNVINYTALDTPITIVDNNTVTSTVEVTDIGSIFDVNVSLDITHTWDSDLDVFLIGPDGTTVELFTDVGGSGDNFTGTVLDTESGNPIGGLGTADAPFTGIFSPEGDLSVFDGTDAIGFWTLSVFDDAGGDSGTIDNFTLNIDLNPSTVVDYPSTDVPITIVDNATVISTIEITDTGMIADIDVDLDITHTWDSDLDVFLTAPDGTIVELFTGVGGSGDNFTGTTLDDEAPIAITSGSAPFTGSYMPEGFLADFDGMSITGIWTLSIADGAAGDDGTLDAWTLSIDVIPTTEYPSADVPVTIIDNDTVVSTIEILDAGTIGDLDVHLDITHTWDSDLDVTLTAPDGLTTIDLFLGVGGSGDNFTDTYLDDESWNPINAGTAPFTGFFSPDGDLTSLEGMSITGIWTLSVTDNAGGDSGTLDAWSLWIDVTPLPPIVDITLDGPASAVAEGNVGTTNATFEIILSAPATEILTVDYATTNAGYANPATPGSDYVDTVGTATFQPGDTSVFVDVPINGDTFLEADEEFGLELSNPSANGVLVDTLFDAAIGNDDVFGNGVVVDFGTDTSPVAAGAVGFTNADYTADLGMGWSNYVNLQTFERNLGSALAVDLASVRSGTFSVDLPNDTYDVKIYYGVVKRIDPFRLTFENDAQIDELLTRGSNVQKTYTVTVSDGQLNMELLGAPGFDRIFRISGFEVNPVAAKRGSGGGDNGGKGGNRGGQFLANWAPQPESNLFLASYSSNASFLPQTTEKPVLAGSVVTPAESGLDSFFNDYGTDAESTSQSLGQVIDSALDEILV